MSGSTALSKAMNGEKIPETQQKGALTEAVDKLKNMGGRLSKVKEVAENVGDAVLHTAETQGTVFAASFAEGYLGEEKLDLGPVDIRTVGGVIIGGYGMYKTMTGKGGEHAMAIGNGLLATGVGRMGRNAGRALAEKYRGNGGTPGNGAGANANANGGNGAGNAGNAAPPAPPPAPPAIPQANGDFGELVRDIFLTPDTAGAEAPKPETAGRSTVPARYKPSRFIRAQAA